MSMAAYLEQYHPKHTELRDLCESLQSVVLEAPPTEKSTADANAAIALHPQTGYFEVLDSCFFFATHRTYCICST